MARNGTRASRRSTTSAPDYAPTLQAWRERFLARLDDVRRLGYDERFVRTWEFYLAYCEAAFRTRSIRDVQLVLIDQPLESLRPEVWTSPVRIWITGASTGIGAATAQELARRGHTLFLTARSADKLAELPGAALPGDVTDRARMHEIADEIGEVDVALLNAGTYVPVDPLHFDADVFREHLDVNVMGTVNCIEAVLPGMLERRAGRIAVVASVTGFAALPRAAAYGATKAFLISMCDSLRADLAGDRRRGDGDQPRLRPHAADGRRTSSRCRS